MLISWCRCKLVCFNSTRLPFKVKILWKMILLNVQWHVFSTLARIQINIHNAQIACATLGALCIISVTNAQGSVLSVATAAANRSNALLAQFAQGRRSAHFELAFLLVDVPATTIWIFHVLYYFYLFSMLSYFLLVITILLFCENMFQVYCFFTFY